VKDVAANSLNGSPVPLGVLGGSLVFRAWDHLAGGELWKTDGTTTGTVQVKDIRPGTPESMPESVTGAVARDRVFFAANDGVAGTELWKTDGTPGGTVLVKDINPGAASSAPTAIVTFGDRVFFLANDGTHGVEIWVSDGTGPGTTLVKDVAPGASAGASGTLVAMGDALYFTGNDGATGLELWKTSGTPVGTARVRDIRPGAEGSAILHLTASGGTLYFTADDGTHGQELWRSNGTDGGTALVADLAPGPGSTLLGFLTDLNGAVLFDADVEPHGAELWRSDGSAAGTVLVKDINPGPDDSLPADLYAANGRVYFSAADDSAGGELWETDGSAAGTRRLADVWPGEESGNPSDFILVGTTLYFRATGRASEGDELWKLDVTPNPPALDIPSGAIAVGASNTVTGTNFTPGSVIKLFVATSSGVLTYGPYTPSAATATSFTWTIPASVALGTGFVALQVINTDTGYLASNVVGALLIGAEVALVPTIARINGVGLAPPDLSIPVAHIDTVVAQGATVTIEGTAFIDPVVNLFTASGNVGPLFPLAGATPNRIQVVIPPTAPTGPGNFQVVNRPSFLVSNAVASTIGAVPSISSVSAAGGVITVRGAGFSTVSVINLFNLQGGAAVNLGGLDGGGPRIPLTVLSDSEFRFARPAGAAAGPSFIEVLNPPFIPFSSSGPDPDGAFSMPPPPPLVTEVGTDVDGAAPADTGSPSRAGSAASGGAPRGELVRWRHAVRARVEGHLLTADDGGADDDDRTPAGARRAGSVGTAWQAGASSTRALVAGPGDLTWTVRAGAGDVALGLTHDDTVPTLADIDYGFRLDAATHELAIVEGGAVRAAVGTYAAGDRLRIAVRTDQVEYRRNGQLVWTSACAPRYPLVADASLGSPEARLAGVRLGGAQLGTAIDWAPAAQPARETARVAAAGPLVLRATAPLAAGGAVQAVLTDGAGIGVGAAEEGCAYCLVRDGTALRLVHAGATRRTWAADPGAVVRVEVTADGLVRYWAGETRLDEAWIAPGDPLGVRGVLNGPGSAVAQAVLTDP
jgi:ELWxxDGT repeat protein